MCGMCGIYSSNTLSREKIDFFSALLTLNVHRGEDSTGVIRVSKGTKKRGGQIKMKKTLDPSPFFCFSEAGNDFITGYSGKYKEDLSLLMGHCRAATVGKVDVKNAHPFSNKNIIGMHNGTISKKFKGVENFETDSEALYNLISETSLGDALEEVNVSGSYNDTAYALQYIDKKTGELVFIRNSRRPLHFALIGVDTLVWSSDLKTLQYAFEKFTRLIPVFVNTSADFPNDEDSIKIIKEAKEKFFTLKENHSMRIRIGKPYKTASFKEEYVSSYTYGWSTSTSGYIEVDGVWRKMEGSTTKKAEEVKEDKKEYSFNETSMKYLDWVWELWPETTEPSKKIDSKPTFNLGGAYFNEEEVEKKLQHGCSVCASPFHVADKHPESFKWFLGGEGFICDSCHDTNISKEFMN